MEDSFRQFGDGGPFPAADIDRASDMFSETHPQERIHDIADVHKIDDLTAAV